MWLFVCFVGTEFLKIQKSVKNLKNYKIYQTQQWFDLMIFSRKLKQRWVSKDIMILPWVSVLMATNSINFDQKVTTFDRFWWSTKKYKNVPICDFFKQIVDLKRLYFWISCWSLKGNLCCMGLQIWSYQTSKKSSKKSKKTQNCHYKMLPNDRKMEGSFFGRRFGGS